MRWPPAWGVACCWSLSTTLSTAHFIPAYMHNHHIITTTIIICKTCSVRNNNSADESLLLMRHRGACRLLKTDLNISFITLRNGSTFSFLNVRASHHVAKMSSLCYWNVTTDYRSNQGTMRTCTLKDTSHERHREDGELPESVEELLMKADIIGPYLSVNTVKATLVCFTGFSLRPLNKQALWRLFTATLNAFVLPERFI